jgi:hypothetical protein
MSTTIAAPLQSSINWLHQNNYPVLPVAPAQPAVKYPAKDKSGNDKTDREGNPLPAFTGKNPSYLDKQGIPRLINHTTYQKRLPTDQEIKTWFENPSNGLGTLGGWNSTIWVDFDVKQFDSQEECDRAFYGILEAHPVLMDSWLEKTHSGGYRLAVKCRQQPEFTNFALEPGGKHRGEALGCGRFTVLAPTIGVSGNAYECMNRAVPVEIESLESIGIYPTRLKVTASAALPDRSIPSPTPGAIPLEMLGTNESREVLQGIDIKGDRSSSLTAAIREWHGWQNWAALNGISVGGTTEDLAHYAGMALSLDNERITRIIKTIEPTECQPAALGKGGEEACWKKVYRLDKATFKAKCPAHIADRIKAEWSKGNESSRHVENGATKEQPQEMAWHCLESHNYQLGRWSKPEFVEDPETESAVLRKYGANPMVRVVTLPDPKTKMPTLALRQFLPKADFDFFVAKNLSSQDGGGLMIAVRWVESGSLLERQAYIKSAETGQVKDFVAALKRELGRNISFTLKHDELQSLLQNRTAAYRAEGGKTYRLAECVGRQSDGAMVFKDLQFKVDGTVTNEDESGWVYNKNLSQDDDIPSPTIADQNPNAFKLWLDAGKSFFHHESFPHALFIAGYFVAVSQHQDIMKKERRFPQLAVFGEKGGGKTTAFEWAASLFGMHHEIKGKITTSAAYELAKNLSCLPLVLDDPIESGKKQADQKELIEALAWGIYNCKPRVVRGNQQYPRTALAIGTNVALGENNSALDSRLIKMFLPVRQHNIEHIPALSSAMENASGGLSQVLSIAYDRDAVKNLESRLLEFLPQAHSRVAASMALSTYFTQRLCDLVGYEFDAFTFCKEKLCPTANDSESGKDSFEDFLEKLSILKSEGLAGEWNITSTTHNGKKSLAIHLPAIWKDFEKKFSTNYSQQSIANLVVERGGESNVAKKFVPDRAEWIDYLKALAEYERRDFSNCEDVPSAPYRPSKSAPRKCLIVPASLVPNMRYLLSNYDDDDDSPASEHEFRMREPQVTSENRVTPDSETQVTCETQSKSDFQAPGYQVTQVTSKTMPSSNSTEKDIPVNSKGARVADVETGAVGAVTDVEDGHFLTIQLDKPLLQKLSDGSKVVSDSLYRTPDQVVSEKRWKAIRANIKVGDRVQYQSQFWDVDKIRADGTLDLDHATLQKATSASPAEVELVKQGVAA